jgi:hypothetical protein
VGFQQIVKELHIELIVLDDQDGFGHPPTLTCPLGPAPPGLQRFRSFVDARAERHAS